MANIDTVLDLIETQLLTDSDWGPSSGDIYWSNMPYGDTQLLEVDCPKTLVFIQQAPTIDSSTIVDHTEWTFEIKTFQWAGGVKYSLADLKVFTALHNQFQIIFNNIIDNLDCAWLGSQLVGDYENIDDRLIILERFSIIVQETR